MPRQGNTCKNLKEINGKDLKNPNPNVQIRQYV